MGPFHSAPKTRIENVWVASELDHPLILGMNWVNRTRVIMQAKCSKIVLSPPQIREQINF